MPKVTIVSQDQRCEYCQHIFHAYRLRRFCTAECGYAFQRGKMFQKVCPVCEKPFEVPEQNKLLMTRIYCSQECAQRYKVGENHPNWKGRGIDQHGYVRIVTGRNERQREHRLVMEAHLGRKLTATEHVHHKNEDKTDNRIENLEVLTVQEHTRLHVLGRPKNPPIFCPRCNKLRPHRAKGYCHSCYARLNLETRMQADPEGTKAQRKKIAHDSYMRRRAK